MVSESTTDDTAIGTGGAARCLPQPPPNPLLQAVLCAPSSEPGPQDPGRRRLPWTTDGACGAEKGVWCDTRGWFSVPRGLPVVKRLPTEILPSMYPAPTFPFSSAKADG